MNKESYKYKLFGRFRGRKNKKYSDSDILKNFKVDFEKDINKDIYTILDIGSGSGENSIYLSNLHKNSQVIACELFEDGNINLCNQIILHKIKNISLFAGNVLEFLDLINQNLIFDEIWVLFPDPWPKIRHNKRRLINHNFLKLAHSYLKKKGCLKIASDSQSYNRSIMNLVHEHKQAFFWENQNYQDWNYDFLDLPKTKFNKKAIKSNKKSTIFSLIKI